MAEQFGEAIDEATLMARARALVPVLAGRHARMTADRRVPDDTIADFHRSGFFQVMQPKMFGGLEMDFRVFAMLVRELAQGCASSAWVYAVIGELGWVMAMFPEQGQREVWGDDPSALGCAAIDPSGKAEKVEGGYRLNGQWRFISGSDHAQWVLLTAPCVEADGNSIVRQFLVRRDEMELVDDWYVLGLEGTGSKSQKANNVFIPEHRTITQAELMTGTAPGRYVHPECATYRSPRRFLTSFSISPVIVGLADRALELVIDAMKKRISSGNPPMELDALQLRIAEAAADVETASIIFESSLRDCTERLASSEPITEKDVLKKRFMGAHMARVARQAVDRLAMASGSGWVFDKNPLQVVFRDAMTGATHRGMNFELHGQNYVRGLGIEAPK